MGRATMKGKMKKVLALVMTAVIGGTVFVGCGKKTMEPQEGLDEINKAKQELFAVSNVSFSYKTSMETKEENSEKISDITAILTTNEWHTAQSNVNEGKVEISIETLDTNGITFGKSAGDTAWQPVGESKLYGKETIIHSYFAKEFSAEDFKKVEKTEEDGNSVLTVTMSDVYIKKTKDNTAKNIQEAIEFYKSNPQNLPENVIKDLIQTTEAKLQQSNEMKYLDSKMIFTIDKEGSLIGMNSIVEVEALTLIPDNDSFKLGDKNEKMKMVSGLEIKSYNDSKNEELVNKLKGEL